ncbi:unnamed protein product [Urochloa decumbens]|uniref:BED-type domain-containing protein n=1 Tax=Urochloa decumbens TaxID=240449 RepID=A0ABC9BUR2_9POAL
MAEDESAQGQKRRRRDMVPRSAVWEHFTRFTDGDGRDKARCNRCHQVLGAATRSGTSSLWGHVRACSERDGACRELHPKPVPPRPPCAPLRSAEYLDREPGLQGGGREEEEEATASRDLARMIALHGYNPSMVEDSYFRSFVCRLSPEFKLPSRITIEEMCDSIFDEKRKGLFSRLQHTSGGRVSLSVGKAEAVEGDVYFTACHFIDDGWNLHRMVMDAYDHLPWPLYHGPLSGVPEVSLNFEDLCSLAIDRIMTIDDDDISGHDVLDRVFMVARDKRDQYIRIEPKDYIERKYPSTYPRRRELIYDTYMDIALCCIARRLTVQPNLAVDTMYAHFIESEVEDLHLTRQRRQHLLSHLGLDDPRTYNERWYSCYCSLEVLHNEGRSSTVPCLDSELIGLLRNIWGTIYRAIKRISASNSPTSNLCLRELFNVREVLQFELARTQAGGHNFSDVLRDTTGTLDKRLQDSYLVWSIPLVLDPRYKLSYIEFNFRRAFNPDRAAYYISEVTRKIKKLYSDYTEHDGVVNGTYSDGATVMAVGTADLLEQAWDEHCRAQHRMTSDGSEVGSSYPEAETELDHYLNDHLAPRTEGFDILNWWRVHSSEYPTVAQMARDALAMPTCSQLSSEQIANVRSIIRGYSKEEYIHQPNATELCSRLRS